MQIKELNLKGVYEITFEPKCDKRGYFMRTLDNKILSEYGLNRNWVQESQSKSEKRGVIRGLHFQFPPYNETKLVRVIKGEILDVFVDLRKNSPTFGKWDSIKLSEENKKMVYIPRGFAHGFCALTNNCELIYKVDNYYSPEHEGSIIWNDKTINIDWGKIITPIISDKDKTALSFQDFVLKYSGITV